MVHEVFSRPGHISSIDFSKIIFFGTVLIIYNGKDRVSCPSSSTLNGPKYIPPHSRSSSIITAAMVTKSCKPGNYAPRVSLDELIVLLK